jgi:hypothetical protein
MAEFLARRVLSARRLLSRRIVVFAAGGAVVVVGAVAGGVALAAGGGGAASPGGGGSAATAPVVRTDLVNTVQEGGALGYGDSYTVSAPSGASASQVTAEQQAVAADEQELSADEQAVSDTSASGSQSVSADQATISADQSALGSDQAAEHKACAGSGSSSACSTDEQKVTADEAALTQAEQQLAAAETAAKSGDDQAEGTVGADRVRLRNDEATLASLLATAVNPGTTYTWLPSAGAVIRQDQRVYSVSGVPVPLLYGPVAAYRAFYVGMPNGPDVAELTRDLRALGYGGGLAQSHHYSQATAAAVERWQRARGLPTTGEILLGEVVFEPGPIRVASVTPTAGSSAGGGGGGGSGGGGGGAGGGGGTVLTATDTTPVVTVSLGVSQEYLVKPGDAVSVTLPDGTTTVGGRVQSVGTVATCPGGGGTGTGNGSGSGSAGQSPCSSSGSGGSGGSNSSPTVTVTITLDSTPPGAALDQAPVNVNITSQRADGVLAVPVNALLALQGGGFGVQVVSGSGTRLLAVTTGLYSHTMVQVSAPGLATGMRVEVPSS